MKKIIILVALLLVSFQSKAELWSAFNAGVGLGSISLNGDFVREQSGTIFELGFNVNQENYLFRLLGRSENTNKFKGSEFTMGYGNRYIKIGTGLMGIQGTIPTTDKTITYINSFGLIRADKSRDTDVSVTTVPLLVSITPYHSDKFMFNVEGYYGVYSRGSMTIPVLAIGQEAYIHTEPKTQGGALGYSASMTWGLGRLTKDLAVQIKYSYQEAKMNRQQTTFKGDALGNLGVINMPDLDLKQETLMLTFVYLTN